MVLLAALAMLVADAETAPRPVAPDRQAQATVRILPAAALRFAELEQTESHRLRETEIEGPDGKAQRARLVEFE